MPATKNRYQPYGTIPLSAIYVLAWYGVGNGIHVWHLFHPELGAGKRAIEQGGAWLRAAMEASR